MTEDNTKKSDIEQSVDQYMAYLNGDDSNVSVSTITLDTPPRYTAAEIKQIRQKVGVTQRHFASLLAVSPGTVEAWEVGRTAPLGSACRLLQLLDYDPKLLQRVLGLS
ncbi:helix-turn-helix domain-containing protein [Schleiferilactobacillus harbinensis]|uniref:helix-turn-helix domain-containing protein n=1 Tax=Schleiferilactobacillus harbinensis TaxID=304207 RepID=UPI00116D25F7|nr:type II toxin-antitoxin system MqsA family antitoxin [Schleiferilactobacillus harbinensis]GEK06359.1 hypothetical protein LHA01_15980 [Schleiferilactobacillus harbinensis]